MEYYIRNGMEPELAVKTVLQNKRVDFEKILDPNSEYAKAIAEGDTQSALGKNAHKRPQWKIKNEQLDYWLWSKRACYCKSLA